MAGDTIDQRLAAIEAAIPTLATKADLEGVAKNVDIQTPQRLVERQVRTTDNWRAAYELQHQMLVFLEGVPGMLDRIVGLLQAFIERLERLEKRGEG